MIGIELMLEDETPQGVPILVQLAQKGRGMSSLPTPS